MFEEYKMIRNSGISPFGAALMSIYLIIVASPLIAFSNWYNRNYIDETIFDLEDFKDKIESIREPAKLDDLTL
jgi:hypothetical protein